MYEGYRQGIVPRFVEGGIPQGPLLLFVSNPQDTNLHRWLTSVFTTSPVSVYTQNMDCALVKLNYYFHNIDTNRAHPGLQWQVIIFISREQSYM